MANNLIEVKNVTGAKIIEKQCTHAQLWKHTHTHTEQYNYTHTGSFVNIIHWIGSRKETAVYSNEHLSHCSHCACFV